MYSFRDFIVFLTGVEFFHTISHFLIPFFVDLPLQTKYMVLTSNINLLAIIINAVITVSLFFWAYKLKDQ
jgi:hypothetical protein